MFDVKFNQSVRIHPSRRTLGFMLGAALLVPGCGDAQTAEVTPPSHAPEARPLKEAVTEGRSLSVRSGDPRAAAPLTRLEEQRSELRTYLRDQPERLALVEGSRLLRDDRLRLRPDGNYDLIVDKQEGPATVVTLGDSFAVTEATRSLREAPTQQSRYEIYRLLRQSLAEDHASRLNLPDVTAARHLSAEALGELLLRIGSDPQIDAAQESGSAPTSAVACRLEEGAGPMGDGAASCSRSPAGLFSRFRFPLRDHQSCVKDQASRGTCVSFAIAGAVETSASILYGRSVNLSEQDLYRYAKWRAGDPAYGDGLVTGDAASAARAYTFAWESEWTYNPSRSRVDTGTSYVRSCDGYRGPFCSDSNHQAEIKCFGGSGCFYWDSAPKSSGLTVASAAELGTSSLGRTTGASILTTGTSSLILSFLVTPSFDGVSKSGLVTHRAGERSRGGHAMQLVGFIRNRDLPGDIPQAAGGGYFIGRNSWGCGFGDGGYVYLPDSFVAEYGLSLLAVSGR